MEPFLKVFNWQALARSCKFSSSEMAERIGVSQRRLRRYFNDVHGLKLRSWLHYQKMRDAGHLLHNSDSIKSVAHALWYRQVCHFCRDFKKAYGMSPRTFSSSQRNLLSFPFVK